jgi:hypothetical protein
MISRNNLIQIVIMVIILGFIVNMVTNIPSSAEEKDMFPGILGDMILKNNETGKQAIGGIISYDDFQGYIVQGYRVNYSGVNGTMTVFIAQMSDNMMANKSLNEMVIRDGYDQSINFNQSDNVNVVKLGVENPEVFAIRKNESIQWHYVFCKLDKVYWIGFSSRNVEYQGDMLMEAYINIDKEKSSVGT